jgi:HAD superfamily hydrolase (TIGR01509 family)
MKQVWGLLLDLDQTLVLTEALQSLRDQGHQWPQVLAQLHLTQLPPNTLAFLQRVRPHLQLGIVTSSPRHYAEKLVAHHRLALPVLAAYHDTPGKHKPDPEPLLYAARKLGLPPSRCLHVGDQAKDIIASHRAGMIPIGLSWDSSLDTRTLSNYPHTLCNNWQDVLTHIRKSIREE